MKKTLLATGLLATMVLGNVVIAAGTDKITQEEAKSTNKVGINPGDAAITSAPSYDFGKIEASDVAKGEKIVILDEETSQKETVNFVNDTLKDIKITVTADGSGIDNFMTGFLVEYNQPNEVGNEVSENTINKGIHGLALTPGATLPFVDATDKVGNHAIKFDSVAAKFTLDRDHVKESKVEGYTQNVTWTLTDKVDGENQNSL